MIVNIIGAGNLGQTIAYLLSKQKGIEIGYVCNRSEISTKAAIQFIGAGKYCPSISDLPPADITFITTPDSCISESCIGLSKYLKPEGIVVHCSGSLTSDALDSARKKGCFITSIHPMRSFAQPALSIQQFQGTYCAIEGDSEAVSVIKNLFESMGAIVFSIDKNKKSLYHAAGVFASNYLVTLSSQALSCLNESGVNNDLAMEVVINIMKGTLSNLEKTKSPNLALTGPIKRADTGTIKKHMASLTKEKKILYSALGNATIPLTTLDEEKKQEVASSLTANSPYSKQPYAFLRASL